MASPSFRRHWSCVRAALFLLLVSHVRGGSRFERYMTDQVLKPWVSAHYPQFEFVGLDSAEDHSLSWEFKDRNDPHLRTTFPLDIYIDPCTQQSTAKRSTRELEGTGFLREPGFVLLKIGDFSSGYNNSKSARPNESVGGWVQCRVGREVIFTRSYSIKFDDQMDLVAQIISALSKAPAIPASVRAKTEKRLTTENRRRELEQREEREWENRLAAKTFTTPAEYLEQLLKTRSNQETKVDENGLTPGARSWTWQQKDPVVTEISLERTGCYGTCPQYAVLMTSDGKVQYFGSRHVKNLGTRTGQIDLASYRALAAAIEDTKLAEMKEIYEDMSITDQETVVTSFVIEGKRKTISDYAMSAPARLWAIEQLIDATVLKVKWDAEKPRTNRRPTPSPR